MSWDQDNSWESYWWGNCVNTYWEEVKQQVYMRKVGIKAYGAAGKYPIYDFGGDSVVDVGGGPVSVLLKGVNVKNPTVLDPCNYPEWINARYKTAGISYIKEKAEEMFLTGFDRAIGYNLLQHVESVEKIVENTLNSAKVIHWFDWIDCGISEGHPHNLTEKMLNELFGGYGKVENLNEDGCFGKCWYGVFKGRG